MNPLLYGHNPDERIVAVQSIDDGTMRLYYRHGDTVEHRDEPFFPFFFLSDDALLRGFPAKHWIKRLEGAGHFQFLCVFTSFPVMWDAIRFILDLYNVSAITKASSYTDLNVVHLYTDPVTQYLMQTGRTLFKGLAFEEVHRLQLDIETYASGTKFSNASRKSDRIILIALSDNRGWSHIINGKKLGEREMLQELNTIIAERDPDVIEGHNILGFDLPYITARCTLHNVPAAFGRDRAPMRSFETRSSFAEHSFEYTASDIPGRHVVDTLILVQSYDAIKRSMEGYGLKYAAKYFGLSSENRTYISGDRISWHWDNDPAPLLAYALDDVLETRALSDHLLGTSLYLTQMLPYSLGTVTRMGSAAKIESLIVREYLRTKTALPLPSPGTQTTGGYTDVFFTGVLGPIVHADVESLYPSIMITQGICPHTDHRRVFPSLLKDLTEMRLDAKRKMKALGDSVERSRVDAMQSSFKILINSFYGYLGYGRGLFNDFSQADRVTRTGQMHLREMIRFVMEEKGKVVEVDTDGVFFVPPPGVDGEEQERAFVDRLSDRLPENITVAFSGRYRKIFSYKKKNYALLEYDRRIRIRGSSLISRAMERFGRTYIHQCVDFVLQGDVAGLHDVYVQTRHAILDNALDVMDFAKIESLRDPIAVYVDDVQSGRRNKNAVYEIARRLEQHFRPGDRVAYYITGSDANPKTSESCKPVHEWDPNFPDNNIPYYLRRLDEFSEKFKDLFSPTDFRAVFSADDLFPFDPRQVTMLIRETAEIDESAEETPHPSPGIWLDEDAPEK